MFGAGADILFAASPTASDAVVAAAVETGRRAIGVTSDRYLDAPAAQQAVIMTSMLKRVDNAVESFIGDYVEGTVEGGTDIVNDLSTEGVGLSTSGGQIEDIQDQIDDFRQQIIDGDIEVPTTPSS